MQIFIGGEKQVTDNHFFNDSDRNTNQNRDCRVTEEAFPCLGKCCIKNSSLPGDAYKKNCPHCSIWTSLPDGSNLLVAHIFECSQYGYGKRVKD